MRTVYVLSLLVIAACKNNSDAAEQTKTKPAVLAAKTPEARAVDGSISITVDGEGFHPASIKAPKGQKAKLVFTRTTDKTCGTEVVFPSLNIKKDLPLNQPTTVELEMPSSGQVAFACGMDMMKGSIIAQ
jgi:plastocyanin domain-containing protein